MFISGAVLGVQQAAAELEGHRHRPPDNHLRLAHGRRRGPHPVALRHRPEDQGQADHGRHVRGGPVQAGELERVPGRRQRQDPRGRRGRRAERAGPADWEDCSADA
jgi:hypothetical protein